MTTNLEKEVVIMSEVNQNDSKELLYKYYSKRDKKLLEETLRRQSLYLKISGIDKNYRSIIQDASKLFVGLCFHQTIHEYFYLYRYMLKHSYFSIQPFRYKDICDSLFDGRCIMSGYGNCRHISGLYQDILQEIRNSYAPDFASSLLDVFFPDTSLEEELKSQKIEANHISVLASQNGCYYIQDVTNNLIFTTSHLLENSPKLCCDSILKHENILIFPESFMAYSSLSKKDLIYHLQKMNDSNCISKKELKHIRKQMKKQCQENIDIFQDFYDRNIDDIEKVYQKVKKTRQLKERSDE